MGWFRGFLWGGLIGAGVALLTTKRTGEENRQMLMDKGQEYMDKAMDMKDRAADKAVDYRDRANDLVNTARDKATQAVNQVANKASQTVDKTANKVSDMSGNIPQTGRSMMDQNRESLTSWSDETRVGDETSDRPTGDDPMIDTTSEKDYDV